MFVREENKNSSLKISQNKTVLSNLHVLSNQSSQLFSLRFEVNCRIMSQLQEDLKYKYKIQQSSHDDNLDSHANYAHEGSKLSSESAQQPTHGSPTEAGEEQADAPKNRFNNIKPFDYSTVDLQNIDDDTGWLLKYIHTRTHTPTQTHNLPFPPPPPYPHTYTTTNVTIITYIYLVKMNHVSSAKIQGVCCRIRFGWCCT